MAILSILGLGVWTGFRAAYRAAERFHARALVNARLLQLDDRFRECANRVRAPWWIDAPAIEASSPASWTVTWLDGSPDGRLLICFDAGVLSLDDGTYRSRFTGFSRVTLAAGLDGRDTPLGMTLTVEGPNLPATSLSARYGSAAVRAPEGT
jgi:hypothetical protein